MLESENSYPTYEDICTFCDEVAGRPNRFHEFGLEEGDVSYVLMQSDSFIVVPCIGALTDWYVLIVPRRHALSAGWLGPLERTELRTVLNDVHGRLSRRSSLDVVIFEHGSYSFRDKGGACHDHAHVHAVATEKPAEEFVNYVNDIVRMTHCDDDWIESAADLLNGAACSYLSLEYAGRSMIGQATGAPSGFFRKALMTWLGGNPAEHDWLAYPQDARIHRMIDLGL